MQPRFLSNIPSINLASNQIWYVALFAFSKFGERRLVMRISRAQEIGDDQKGRNILNK